MTTFKVLSCGLVITLHFSYPSLSTEPTNGMPMRGSSEPNTEDWQLSQPCSSTVPGGFVENGISVSIQCHVF